MNRYFSVVFSSLFINPAWVNADSPSSPSNQDQHVMSNLPTASRPAPPQVAALEYRGIRYEQDMQSHKFGGDQPGGYLVAIKPNTGERLWMLKVYKIENYDDQGLDIIGRYFKSMRLIPEQNAIEIENEAGGRYLVDLEKHTSTLVFEPSARLDKNSSDSPPPPPPPPPKP